MAERMAKTEIVSTHWRRSSARSEERRIQREIDTNGVALYKNGTPMPDWVSGARVRKAGLLSYVVEATEWQGH